MCSLLGLSDAVNENLPVPIDWFSYREQPAGMHALCSQALAIGPWESCHHTERDLLAYCRSLLHRDHLLSPQTHRTQRESQSLKRTPTCNAHIVWGISRLKNDFFSFFVYFFYFLCSCLCSHFNHSSAPLPPSPSTPSFSFSLTLLIPTNIHLANAPIIQTPPSFFPTETTSPRLLLSHSAWLVPMYS